MVNTNSFVDEFNSYNAGLWHKSNYTQSGSWMRNDWDPDNVVLTGGNVELKLDTSDSRGKTFTGGELASDDTYGYGRFETVMKTSSEVGVVSTFFTYTGSPWNEIDMEFLGKDPTKVHLAYHNQGTSWTKDVDLGFDGSKGFHEYAFEWRDGNIKWYADDKLLYSVSASNVPDKPGNIIASIWTGIPEWLGNPNFGYETKASYSSISYTPLSELGSGGGSTPSPAPTPTPTPTPSTPTNVTMGLFLYDADTEKMLTELKDGGVYDLDNLGSGNLSIAAIPTNSSSAGAVESVKFDLSGEIDRTTTESMAPYALFGDSGGNLNGRDFSAGDYTISADAYSNNYAGGSKLFGTDIDFEIRSGGSSPTPTNPSGGLELYLVDANSDKTLMKLYDNAEIDISDYGTSNYAIEARATSSGIESIRFDLDGATSRTAVENLAPYALFGDDTRGNFYGRNFGTGDYSLAVDAYSDNYARGGLVSSLDFDLSFV